MLQCASVQHAQDSGHLNAIHDMPTRCASDCYRASRDPVADCVALATYYAAAAAG